MEDMEIGDGDELVWVGMSLRDVGCFYWNLMFWDSVLRYKLYMQIACIDQSRFEKDLREFSSKSYYSNSSKGAKRNWKFLI